MSAQHTTHAAHGHGGHDDHHDDGPHSTLSGYMTGFILSIILTAIPFWLVMAKVIADRNTAVLVLGAFAVVQIVVHMVYFLHMNGKLQGGWTMLSTVFTVVFLAIGVAGTLWVMYQMNLHMMPTHEGAPAISQPTAVEAAAPVAAPAVQAPAAEAAPAAEQAPAAEPAATESAAAEQPAHGGHGSN